MFVSIPGVSFNMLMQENECIGHSLVSFTLKNITNEGQDPALSFLYTSILVMVILCVTCLSPQILRVGKHLTISSQILANKVAGIKVLV